MATRQLFLPLHQAHSLIIGEAKRVFVKTLTNDAAALRDEGWLIVAGDGYVRFAVGDSIVIAGPDFGHILTVQIARLSDTPTDLAELSHAVAREHGYSDVSDLWQDYAHRYDHPAHKHWKYLKGHVRALDYADVFRSFIKTRERGLWGAWSLQVNLVSVNVNVQKGIAS